VEAFEKQKEVIKMADFTIEVKKKEKDEDFKFEDLEMYHQECYGGKIKIEVVEVTEVKSAADEGTPHALFKLSCTRCGREIYLDKNSNSPAEVIKTSIDGKEREIDGIQIEYTELFTNFNPLRVIGKLKT
jgi:hypothetical protein